MSTPKNPERRSPDGVRTITDAKALSAMANAFRSRMMDALKDAPGSPFGEMKAKLDEIIALLEAAEAK